MDDEYDACECVWSHEFAMRRLLALIRQNQNECTDTYCLNTANNVPENSMLARTPAFTDDSSNFTIITIIMAFLLFFYIMWPRTPSPLRTKHRGGPPPAPPAPPAMN